MLDLELPRRIAVTAGIRAARIYYEQGERKKAFELLKRVDSAYPHHHERVAAGSLLAEVGFSFAADGQPFRSTARELLALIALGSGDTATARELSTDISDDREAPAGLRQRATQMLAALRE